jgi:hypothetical protein
LKTLKVITNITKFFIFNSSKKILKNTKKYSNPSPIFDEFSKIKAISGMIETNEINSKKNTKKFKKVTIKKFKYDLSKVICKKFFINEYIK